MKNLINNARYKSIAAALLTGGIIGCLAFAIIYLSLYFSKAGKDPSDVWLMASGWIVAGATLIGLAMAVLPDVYRFYSIFKKTIKP